MDRDFVKKVLAIKENQLAALPATPANAAARDKLSREITSINIYLKCGEIADIVGMNEPRIEALNYVPAAIHDHHSDTRLSSGQKRQVTTLKNELAALSPNYLAIFEKRCELYRLRHGGNEPTNMSELIGIEIPPYSRYLGVNPSDEIDYVTIRDEIIALNPNDAVVDFAAMRPLLLADAMDKLNNASTASAYRTLKAQYFPVVEEFMRTDHDATVAYFKNIGNPNFAADLKQKYPNEEVLLSVAGTDKLLKHIKRLNSNSPDYRSELDLFKANFARLYEDPANHTELNRILNSARRSSKFEFRSDLQAALADIDGLNADLGIRDSELADFAKYVSDHYDSMSPELQEKMYAMLKTKLENNLADQATVASANAALANINNIKLDLKIQKDMERFNQVAVYKHPNLLAYTKDIDAKITKLTEQKNKLIAAPKLNMDGFVLVKQIDAAIDKLNNSLTTLDPAQVQNFNPTQAAAANVGTDALSRTQAALDNVNTELARTDISPMYKAALTKQKEQYTAKIAKLQAAQNARVNGNRFFLLPKAKVQGLEVLTAQELRAARDAAYAQRTVELRAEAQSLMMAGGLINGIKALIKSGEANRITNSYSISAMLGNGSVLNNGSNPFFVNLQAFNNSFGNTQGGPTLAGANP